MQYVNGMLITGAWDDLRFPVIGQRLDSSSGRISYDYAEVTVDFATNARYPEEFIGFTAQMPHSKQFGFPVHPHIHWIQEEDDTPNWLLAYRWYNTEEAVPSSWDLVKYSSNVVTYTSGDISQLFSFPAINKEDDTLSSILQLKLYRDQGNVSELFSGADTYSVGAKLVEFDLHIKKDTAGSAEEFNKF